MLINDTTNKTIAVLKSESCLHRRRQKTVLCFSMVGFILWMDIYFSRKMGALMSLTSSLGLYSWGMLRFSALLLWSWWAAVSWQRLRCRWEVGQFVRQPAQHPFCVRVLSRWEETLCQISNGKQASLPRWDQTLWGWVVMFESFWETCLSVQNLSAMSQIYFTYRFVGWEAPNASLLKQLDMISCSMRWFFDLTYQKRLSESKLATRHHF